MDEVPPIIEYRRHRPMPVYPLLKRSAFSLLGGGAVICACAACLAYRSAFDALIYPCFLLSPIVLLIGLICGISGLFVAQRGERGFATIAFCFSLGGCLSYLYLLHSIAQAMRH